MTTETHPIEKEQVMAYLDGELSPQASARVAAHLADCPECHALEAELRSVTSQMLAWTIESSSDRLNQGVNAAVQAKPTDASRRLWEQVQDFVKSIRRLLLNRWVWATACGIVAMMIVWRVHSRPPVELYNGTSALMEPLQAQLKAPPPFAPNPGLTEDKDKDSQSNVAWPMIARTASLNVSVKDFAAARAAMDGIIGAHHGYAASLTISSQKNEPQSLEAALQIPSAECDTTLAALKALGHVQKEEQGGEEVTAQVVDLDARLKNARITETRLEEILRTRTGKVSDVLEVEKEISNVRESIEQMEAQQKELHKRISFAAIQLSLHEEYEASLDVAPSSVGRRIRNAFVDGFHAAADGLVEFCVFLLHVAPSLILAAVILFWPARFAWRRLHKA